MLRIILAALIIWVATGEDIFSSIFNATEANELISKGLEGTKMPALRALAYLTSELTYVGGAILLTPIRLLTRYHPLEKYAIGDVSLKHLRAGIGRDQINANNFRHDYPVIKVINNNDHALNNHCSALVFIADIYKTELQMYAYPSIIKYCEQDNNFDKEKPITLYYWNKNWHHQPQYIGRIKIDKKLYRLMVRTNGNLQYHTQNWPGGFVINSGIVIGIISGCRFDTEHSNEVFLRIIPINGRITPEDDVLIEI